MRTKAHFLVLLKFGMGNRREIIASDSPYLFT